MKTYRQPSGLTIGLDFLIDSDWTPEQALAVVELLDDLKDRILLHYQCKRPARPSIPRFSPVIQNLPMQQETAAIHQYDYWAKSVIFLKYLLAKPQGLIHSISRCPASFE